MNLVKVEEDIFLDVETNTTYEFVLFNYPMGQKEAERRAYAHFRWYQDKIGLGDYYGNTHLILATYPLEPR